MNGHKVANKSTTSPTLVEICHPEFRRGYQQGRWETFREKLSPCTDIDLVQHLTDIFAQPMPNIAVSNEEELYYSVGHLMGELSHALVPFQSHEYAEQKQEISGVGSVNPS